MHDKKIIESMGGISAVARTLGVSPQRVFNWSKRGIPAAIKVEYPDLFLTELKTKKKTGTKAGK